MRQTWSYAALIILGAGCSSGTVSDDGAASAGPGDGSDEGSDAAPAMDTGPSGDTGSPASDAGPAHDDCTEGDAICTASDARRACEKTAQGTRWVDETCPAGQGCVKGQCTPSACSDECNLGETQNGKTCAPWDVSTASKATLDAAGKMHDRARAYEMWLERDGRPNGGVGSARYADPGTYATLEGINGLGDSALWTGTYLASQALRLMATGAPDARARIASLVDTIHRLFSVTGDPGMLARFAAPSGVRPPYALYDLDCTQARVHCGVDYQGQKWDWIGKISRDAYQGPMLGYALAYEALSSTPDDEKLKDTIRGDVVTFVKELMRERTLPVKLTYNGVGLPVTAIKVRFVVVSTPELDNGAIDIDLAGSGSKAATMSGFQEFTPDLGDIVSQIVPFSPPIPRSSSAIMLASFFRVALRVTDVPSAKADHDAILDYYLHHSGQGGNVTDWLGIAAQWSQGSDACGANYYANNITMEPMYNLARLEDDAQRKALVQGQILGQTMWPVFAPTKNSFFSFIYAANAQAPDASVVSIAKDQLGQFPAPPRIHVPVDLRGNAKYMPHDATCADQTDHGGAVDVGARPVGDFLWQRQPWGLYDGGDPKQSEPGVDYLVAYWMGRRHDFFADDTPAVCLRLQ
jgi:hypothetical protein